MDPGADVTYIAAPVNRAFKEHVVRHPRGKAKIVWWNLERPDVPTEDIGALPGNAVHASTDSVAPLVDAIWVSDLGIASLDKRYRYVFLASDERLAEGSPLPFEYDFCHMAYIWGRREVYGELAKKWKVAPAAWGEERVRIMRSSRAMVNIRQTPAPVRDPLRFALAAAYKMPIFTERMELPEPLSPHIHYSEIDLAGVGIQIAPWLKEGGWHSSLKERGIALHEIMCREHNFRDAVLGAVRETFP
jgi:hypothetical protein